MKQKLECEWCPEQIPPFRKLREGGFICDKCYKKLEEEQKEFEAYYYE